MIKYLVMDVDGTLTDGKIYMSSEGEACKAFNIKDGCGIHDILIPAKILPVIITGRTSNIVKKRCVELGIKEVHQGVTNKVEVLKSILNASGRCLENVAYIGDDINDLQCMNAVKRAGGVVGCPSDATYSVCQIADYVCSKKGGSGAVREFIEWLIDRNR